MPSKSCKIHHETCNCVMTPNSMQQSIEEIGFMRSACAAAKSGNMVRLREVLDKNPDAVHGDGVDG